MPILPVLVEPAMELVDSELQMVALSGLVENLVGLVHGPQSEIIIFVKAGLLHLYQVPQIQS